MPMYTVSAISVIRHFQHSRTFHFSIPKEQWHAKVRRDFDLVIFNTEACVIEKMLPQYNIAGKDTSVEVICQT